jgi:hypothetical protein
VTESIRTIAMSLSLNCLVLGDEQQKMFTLEIEKTKNVSILKDLIKEKKASRLEHVDASDLVFWMIDLHLDDFGAEPVHVDLDIHSKLSPRTKLSVLFKGAVDDELLHIIAKSPGTSH